MNTETAGKTHAFIYNSWMNTFVCQICFITAHKRSCYDEQSEIIDCVCGYWTEEKNG